MKNTISDCSLQGMGGNLYLCMARFWGVISEEEWFRLYLIWFPSGKDAGM